MKTFLLQGGLAASLIAAGALPAAAQTGGYGSMLPMPTAPSRTTYVAQGDDMLIPPAEPLPGSRAPVGSGMDRSVVEPAPTRSPSDRPAPAPAPAARPDYSRFPGPPATTGASAGAAYGASGYVGGGYAEGGYASGGYGAGCDSGSFVSAGPAWDEDVYCEPACCGPTVFAGAYGLMMTRDRANPTWTSYDTSNVANQMMKTEDASFGYGGGVEVFGGICCGGGWAMEGRYWGWYPGQAEANVYDPDGTTGTAADLGVVIPNLDMLNYNPGGGATDVDSMYQNAYRHRIRMETEIHNVELNLFNSPLYGVSSGCGDVYGAGYAYGGHGYNAFSMNVLAGARYLRFDEGFLFSADPTDGAFTGAADEIHYLIETENNLIGAQVGGNMSWFATRRFSVNTGAKIGLYANQMNHRQFIRGSNGYATVGAIGPYAGQAYHVVSDDTRISVLGELDMGVSYRVFDCMRLTGGYRIVSATGVALTENQIPTYFAGLDDVQEIDSNGSLLLHGAYAGVEFCW